MSEQNSTHFLLSGYELVMSFFVGLGVFLLINIPALIDRYREQNREGVDILEQEVSQNFSTVLDNISAVPITATVATLLLWMFVGVIVYFLTNYFIKFAQDIGDDVKVSAFYVHPKHFKQSRFWFYVLLQTLY